MYKKIKKIAKGWSSYIWLVKNDKGKLFVRKEVREKSNRKNLAEREGKMLSLANNIGVGPKLFEVNFKENFVIMDYVRGEKFFDFVFEKEFEKMSKKELYNFLKELLRQGLLLDKIGLRHNQLQVGKNILVIKKIVLGKKVFWPIIIDFEKSSLIEKNKSKNFGQLTSFLFYNPNGIVAKKVREKLDLEL
jgi:putative serine/threonine protein kinase